MTREQQKQIIRLRADGEGYKKIAAVLGLSVNTIKSFCRRYEDTQPRAAKYARPNEGGLPFSESISVKPLPEDNSRCLRCNNPIQLVEGRRKRLFCSDACRVAYWRTKAVPMQRRACLGCGELLLGNDLHRKFCSHSCYINFRFGKAYAGGHNGKSIWKGTEPSVPGRRA